MQNEKYKIILLAVMAIVAATACSQIKSKDDMEKKNVLVVFFSATGTTRHAAEELARIAGADLCEIVPAQPYTSADLDWNDKRSRSSIEMANPQARPAVKSIGIDIKKYDRIFLGYPIWWDLAPRVVNTFIERQQHHRQCVSIEENLSLVFDTAEGYGKELYYPGHNEEIVGRAVKGFRNEAVIATKLHIQPETVEDCGSVYAAVRRHLERSLKNLQTGYVDLYYLHRINMEVDYLEVAHAMGRLIQEGLVREWGISAVDKAQLEAAHAVTPVGAVQNIYSMVERIWYRL